MTEDIRNAPSNEIRTALAVYKLAEKLLRRDDYEGVLKAILEEASGAVNADGGFLVLRYGDELDYKVLDRWARSEELIQGKEPHS